MANITISKKTLEICGIVLLTLLFIFDGLSKLFDTESEAKKFKIKMMNLEATYFNYGILLFKFERFLSRYYRLIIRVIGLCELVGGAGLLFFEETNRRI